MEKVLKRHRISKAQKSMNLEISLVESIRMTISFLAVAEILTAVLRKCKFAGIQISVFAQFVMY